MQEIKLPKRGQAMEEGLILEWKVNEGDSVSTGDTLVIFETDKTTAEIKADQDGVFLSKLVGAGETVSIGTKLGYVGTEVEASDVSTEFPPGDSSPSSEESSKDQPISHEETPSASVPTKEFGPVAKRVRAAPSVRQAARENDVKISDVGSAFGVKIVHQSHIEQYVNNEINEGNNEEIRGSPAARRIADNQDIRISTVGKELDTTRVRMDDVERYVEAAPETSSEDDPTLSVTADEPNKLALHETVSISGGRKVMFDRMQTVATEYGSTTTIARVDVTNLISLIEDLKESWETRPDSSPSLTAFIIRAVAQSLPDYKILNAEVVDQSDSDGEPFVRKFKDINIGLAVDTDHGLLVPTIYNADDLSVSELETEILILANQARNQDLEYGQQQNATFTVSNAGTFGAYINTPQINPPQTGILGVCSVNEEPGVVEGEVIPRQIMHLSLTYDHRVVEGSFAVQFLQTIKSLLEKPESLLS